MEGPVWYPIYHQLPVVTRGKQTPLLINQWEKVINVPPVWFNLIHYNLWFDQSHGTGFFYPHLLVGWQGFSERTKDIYFKTVKDNPALITLCNVFHGANHRYLQCCPLLCTDSPFTASQPGTAMSVPRSEQNSLQNSPSCDGHLQRLGLIHILMGLIPTSLGVFEYSYHLDVILRYHLDYCWFIP